MKLAAIIGSRGARYGARVRTPTVLQMEAVECGAASLAMILGYYGRIVPLEKLREGCGVSRNGTRASALARAARQFGLRARGFTKEPAEARLLPPPFIVFWNFKHFLVVDGFRGEKVYLNDPACGPRVVTAAEFDQYFTGVVLTFEKTPEFRKGGKRQSLLHFVAPRLEGTLAPLFYLFLATACLVLPGLAIPVLYRVYIDEIVVGGMQTWLRPLLLAMLIACVLKLLLTWVQQHCLLRMEIKLSLRSSGQFFWHVLSLPMEFFSQRWPSEVGSRVEVNDGIAALLSGELATNAVNVLMIGVYAALMVQYDVLLTVVGVGISLLNVLALRWVSRQRKDANRRLQQERGQLIATTMAGLQMIETLKASGSESDFYARWAGHQAKVVNSEQDLGVSSQLVIAVPPFLAALNLTAVLGLGGMRVMDGVLSMGMLIALQSLIGAFADPVNRLVDLGGKLQEAEAHLSRLEDVLCYPAEAEVAKPETAPREVHTWRLEGALELKNITFGYSRSDPPLIEDFNLCLRPGQRVALVGASGSGKSTVSKIVCGLYKPWSGQVLLDGRTRETIPREVLSNSVAMVDQDIFLFHGTIRENLTLWDPTIPEAAIVQAAKDAQIHDDINERPGGYDSMIEEGGRNFSGGQRQRLVIARALVTNPRVLVLDEATSALDPRVEQLVDESLRRRGCTTLIVAHRLSTIRDCDEIIVLERGVVAERGTHASMSRHEGSYLRLVQTN